MWYDANTFPGYCATGAGSDSELGDGGSTSSGGVFHSAKGRVTTGTWLKTHHSINSTPTPLQKGVVVIGRNIVLSMCIYNL